MAYVGDISTYIRQSVQSANSQIRKQYEEYLAEIDKIQNPFDDATILEKLSIVGSLVNSFFIDGIGKSVTGFVSGTFTALLNSLEQINNLSQLEQSQIAAANVSGGPLAGFAAGIEARFNRIDEAGALFVNDLKATASTTAISFGATAVGLGKTALSLVGVETNWNNQWAEDAVRSVAQIQAKTAYEIKTADPSKNIFENPDISPQQNVSGANVPFTAEQFERSAEWFKDAEENYEKYKTYLDENYDKNFRAAIDFVNSVKIGVDKFIDSKIVQDITGETKANELYGQYEWYGQLKGVTSSMAAVIAGRYIGKFISDPTLASAVSNSYFGVQVFGNSFAEARENGATMQDAYTYAYANAAIETLIENIGGYKPGGAKTVLPTDFNAFIRGLKVVGRSALEEGVEEVASEFATPGFDFFSQPLSKQEDFNFDRFKTETAFKRVGMAFIAGALSGGIFGGSQYILNRNTLNEKINLFQDAKQLKVDTAEQKAKAAKIIQKTTNDVLKALNAPKGTRGYKVTASGKAQMGTLNNSEKLSYLIETGLTNVYEVDWQATLGVDTQQQVEQATAQQVEQAIEKGTLVFKYRDGVVFDETIFNAYYGTDANGARVKVNDGFWGINDATTGVELTNSDVGEGKKLRLVPKNALNEVGKKILERAKNIKIPVVVVQMTPEGQEFKGTTAFYSNGVIYVNQDATGMTDAVIEQEIVKHELIHLLAAQNPAIYKELEKIVIGELLDISIDYSKTGQMVEVKSKKEGYKGLFELLKRYGYVAKLNASLNDMLTMEIERIKQSVTPETFLQQTEAFRSIVMLQVEARMKEETVAYLAEIIVKDTKGFLSAIEGKNPKLIQNIEDVFADRIVLTPEGELDKNPFAKLSQEERKAVERFTKTVGQGVKEVAERRSLAGFFIDQAFGSNAKYEQFILPSALKKYGEKAIINALKDLTQANFLLQNQGKPKQSELEIKYKNDQGQDVVEKVDVKDVFFFKEVANNFKKVDAGQPRSEKQDFIDKFVYEPSKVKEYEKALRAYIFRIDKIIEQLQNGLDIANPDKAVQAEIKKLKDRLTAANLLAIDFNDAINKTFIGISDFAKESVYSTNNPKLDDRYIMILTGGTPNRPAKGIKFSLSADVKKNFLGLVVYEMQQLEKTKQQKPVGGKVSFTGQQTVSPVKLNAISAILTTMKRFLQKHSPVLAFRTEDWINSAFLSDDTSPGFLTLRLDFAMEFEKKFGKYDKNNKTIADNYRKEIKQLAENYKAALTMLLGSEHTYTLDNGDSRTRTFSLEDWEFDTQTERNEEENNAPTIVVVSITPTEKNIQKQIDKIVKIEEARKTGEQEESKPGPKVINYNQIVQRNEERVSQYQQGYVSLFEQLLDSLVVIRNNISLARFASESSTLEDFDMDVFKTYILAESIYQMQKPSQTLRDAGLPNTSFLAAENIKIAGMTGKNFDTTQKALSIRQAAFFNNSVIRDNNGSITVMFHGSTALFENFSPHYFGSTGTRQGYGYYFAVSKSTASQYGDPRGSVEVTAEAIDEASQRQGVKVLPYYLNIKKPLLAIGKHYEMQNGIPVKLEFDEKRKNEIFTKEEVSSILSKIIEKAGGFKVFFEAFLKNGNTDSSAKYKEYAEDIWFQEIDVNVFFSGIKTQEQFIDAFSKALFLEIAIQRSGSQIYNMNKEPMQFRDFISQMHDDFIMNGNRPTQERTYENFLKTEEKFGFSISGEMIPPLNFIQNLHTLIDISLNLSSQKYREQKEGQGGFDSNVIKLVEIINTTHAVVQEATGFDGVLVGARTNEVNPGQSDAVAIAWFQNQIKSITNYSPDYSAKLYGEDASEPVQFSEKSYESEAYNNNSATIVVPYFRGKLPIEGIKKALAISPIVIALLPRTWVASASNQLDIPKNAKIISIKNLPDDIYVRPDVDSESEKIHVSAFVIVNKTDERFDGLGDLRLDKTLNSVKGATIRSIDSTNELKQVLLEETRKKRILIQTGLPASSFAAENVRIIPSRNASYSQEMNKVENFKVSTLVSKFEQLNQEALDRNSTNLDEYVLPPNRINEETGKEDATGRAIYISFSDDTVLQAFDLIDFDNLFRNGSVLKGAGFTIHDLVGQIIKHTFTTQNQEEGGEALNLGEIKPKKVVVSEPTKKQNTLIRQLFGDAVITSIFEVDKDGKLRAKYKRFNKNRKTNQIKTISGKTYSGDVHAINVEYNSPINTKNINERVPDEDYARIDSLTPQELVIFETLVSAGFNFGFYRKQDSKGGYSMPNQTTNFFLINIGNQLAKDLLTEIAVHEQFHEIFKSDRTLGDEIGKALASLLFERDPADGKIYPTEIAWTLFNATRNGVPGESAKPFDRKNVLSLNSFINYLTSSYDYMKGEVNVVEDVYNALNDDYAKIMGTGKGNATTIVRIKNEITAQIVGFMFNDKTFYEQFLNTKPSTSIKFLNIFTAVANNPAIPQAKKDLLMIAAKKYVEINKILKDKMNTLFPAAPLMSNKDINRFIKVYSDGAYNTKIDLIAAYLNERDNKRKGPATNALNTIIYMAGQYENIVQVGSETYGKLRKAFSELIKSANYVVNAPVTEVVTSLKAQIKNRYESLIGELERISKRIMKGELKYLPGHPATIDPLDPTKLNEAVKDQTIDLEAWLNNFRDAMEDFVDEYGKIQPEIAVAFNMPSFADVKDMMEKAIFFHLDSILKYIETRTNLGNFEIDSMLGAGLAIIYASRTTFEDFIKNYFDAVDLITKRTAINSPEGTIAALIQQRETIFKGLTNLTVTQIRNKVTNALARLAAGPLQSQSPISKELNDARKLIQEVIENLSNYDDVKKMQDTLLNLMTKVAQVSKDILKTKFDFGKMTQEQISFQADYIESLLKGFNKSLITIHMELGLLFDNVSKWVMALPDTVATTEEKAFIVDEATKDPSYNPSAVGSAFAKIISLLNTRYTSSLSGDTKSHDELSEEIDEQFSNYMLNRKNKRKAIFDKVDFQTPQDYFRKLREFFEGTDIKIFDILWDNYVKSVLRAETILQEFDVSYLAFNKANPGLQKLSLEDVENGLDPEILLQIPQYVLTAINKQIEKDKKEQEEQVDSIKEKIKVAEGERKQIQAEIAKLEEEKKLYVKGSFLWQQIQAKIRALRTKKQPFVAEKKNLRTQIDAIALIDENKAFKEAVKTHLINNPDQAGNQSITLGQVITMFMGVSRELEMAEIAAQQRENGEVQNIMPTNHFAFGSKLDLFDNEILRKEGYAAAKAKTRPLIILSEDKKALRDYLKSILDQYGDVDTIIDYAVSQFNVNYELLNEEYEARFGEKLPYQSIYIPFSSVESDYSREFEQTLKRRANIGVATGMVTETTLGANIPLKIENIFSVMERHTVLTANYSYERLIKDWQNLLVNKVNSGKSPLSEKFKGVDNALGTGNNFIEFFNRMFADVLDYTDITESGMVKFLKKALARQRAALLSLSPTSPIKQLGSLYNVSIKNEANFLKLLGNMIKTLPRNKYYKWLYQNNSNFYWRVKTSNIPDLAQQINTSPVLKTNNAIDVMLKFGLKGMGYLDAVVIVAAFKTFADDIRSRNPSLTEDQVLEQANTKLFNEVLLYGVANTNPAFRSHFSNRKDLVSQVVSKFQSENILHWSAIIRQADLFANGIKGSGKELLKELLALFMSAFWSALVTTGFAVLTQKIDSEDILFEAVVNDFVWGNIVGSLPYINTLTQLMRFDPEKVITTGYEFRVPILSDVFQIIEIISNGLINQDTGNVKGRQILRIFEIALLPLGIPLGNIRKIVEMLVGVGSSFGLETAIDASQWFAAQTDAQALSEAVSTGNRTFINKYVEDAFSNVRVAEHIAEVLQQDRTIKLSLKNEDYFITVDADGKRTTHDVPAPMKTKYRKHTMNAIKKLLGKSAYLRLKPKDKAKVLQRIINYYWNFMKEDILNDRKPIQSDGDIDAVVERAIYYAYN
jgi:hypothetical protein